MLKIHLAVLALCAAPAAFGRKFEIFPVTAADRFAHSPTSFTTGLAADFEGAQIFESIGLENVSRVLRYDAPHKSHATSGAAPGMPPPVKSRWILPHGVAGSIAVVPGAIFVWDLLQGWGWVLREPSFVDEQPESSEPTPLVIVGHMSLPFGQSATGLAVAELPYCDSDNPGLRSTRDAYPYILFSSNGTNVVNVWEFNQELSYKAAVGLRELYLSNEKEMEKMKKRMLAAGAVNKDINAAVRTMVNDRYTRYFNKTDFIQDLWIHRVPHEDFAVYHKNSSQGVFSELEVVGSHLWMSHVTAPIVGMVDVRGIIRRRARARQMAMVRRQLEVPPEDPPAPPAEPRRVPLNGILDLKTLWADANATLPAMKKLMSDNGEDVSGVPHHAGAVGGLAAQWPHYKPDDDFASGRGLPVGVWVTGRFWPTMYGVPPPEIIQPAPRTCAAQPYLKDSQLGTEAERAGNFSVDADLPEDPDTKDRAADAVADRPDFDLPMPEEIEQLMQGKKRRKTARRFAEVLVAVLLVGVATMCWFRMKKGKEEKVKAKVREARAAIRSVKSDSSL